MEEYPYPIVVEGDWNPEHSKSLKNKLHIYFQSRKKSQGGDCVVQVNENSSAATVRFKSSEVRDGVLSKADHVITFGKDNVNLKVSKPSDAAKEPDSTPQLNEQASGYQEPIQSIPPTESDPDVKNLEESYAVVLENVADDFTKGVLSLLVENVSGLLEKDFSMELIPELKTAVVTFNIPRVAGKFLEESKTHRKFKDCGLKARALERSTCVRVENLPSDANKMLLELYFEKWGGPVEETITLPMEQVAIITFKNLEDMEKARKMEHTINEVPVKIHPYYKSLGTALYGSNRPTWNLPEPFKVDIHPTIREFLLKKKLISSIIDKMSSQFCQINIDKPEVLLTPDPALLKQKGLTRKHVDGWGKNASEAFESIISNYKAFELPVLYPLWTKVENEIKEMVKDLVFTHMDSSKGVLTVAGLAHDVNDLRPLLEKMLERASAQMEREKNSLTEDMEMTPGMYSLLLQDGLPTATAASPQLCLDYNKKINKLHLSGLKTEILTFKNWVLEKQLKMKQTPLKIDRSLLEFLKSVDCDEMSKDLFTSHGISAVYTVENGDVILIGSTEQALSEAQKRLNVFLQSADLRVENQGVLPQWDDLIKQQQRFSVVDDVPTNIFVQSGPPTRSDPDVKNQRESYAVVLENVADDFTKDLLCLLVETVSGLSEKDFAMELILNTAVVTFKSPSAVGKFLEESKKHKKFKDCGLKARALERSTCIRVENLPPEAIEMLLELYFEKWGGPVEEIITLPMEQAAIVSFKNEEDKEKILKKEHTICDVPVKIYPYYKSLNTALYGSNRPTWKLPEPFKVNTHPAIGEFLLKKKLISSISDQMSSQFCQINIDKPEVLLSPDPALLKQKGLTRKHVDGWRKNASEAFESIISKYKAFELPVSYLLWTKVENEIKEMVKDLVFTHIDSSKGVLTVAGLAHDVTDLRPLLEKMLERASAQMEREKNSLTEDMEMTPGMYSLLLQDGLQTATAASPQLRLDYNMKMNKLHLSGVLTEILTFKNWVREKKLNMKQTPLKIDRSLLEFLRSVDCDEMSKDLFVSHGISAVYTVENGDLVLIGSTDRALSEAQERLNMVLQTKDVIVEDQGVLALPQWHNLSKQVEILYNTSKKRTVLIKLSSQRDKVIVSGFKETVIEISQTLGDFIEKHTRVEDVVRVKSHAVVEFIKERKLQDWHHFVKSNEVTVHFDSKRPRIKVSGEGMSVQPVMIFFKKMADVLYADTLIIKKAGAKKYFKEEGQLMLSMLLRESVFVVVLQEDHMLEEENSMKGFLGKVSTPSHGVITMPVGQVRLEVSSGDITKERTDAIVNSSNQTFSLKTGVSKAILDAAGLQVERECLQIAATNKQQTEIVTSAGQLPCGNIIHIIGRNKPSEIKDVVLSVLKICDTKQLSSVAFPALGTGQGGVNPADVADAMVDAVVDFVKRKNTANVKLVKFLIFQTSMVSDFKQSMLKRSGEIVEEEKGVVHRRIKSWTKETFGWGNSESTRNEEFIIVTEDIEPAVFQLCGETQQDINKARDMINSLIIKEHMNIQIRDPAFDHFTREDAEMLNAMQRELTISIKLERKDQDPVITLEGLTKDVHTAESRIRDMIRKVERIENRRREAFMVNSLVEWKYLASGQNLKSFDIFTNFKLEKALQSNNTSVKIKIDNDEYTVDLVFLQATRGSRRIELQRVDLSDRQYALPSNWDDMKGKSVVLVNLTATSNEYADVEKEFRRTGLTFNIFQIERVQNSTLWKNYMIKKEDLEAKNKHKNNEKLLFHGTAPDKMNHINHHGFNRSFAGMNGALFGNGTYFAVDPSYSAQGYSKPDASGHKRMYLARVLVGDFTQGKAGMLVPPVKSSISADLYNSVTDNTNNPTMFVIFNDVQAYPEYLITFQ